MAKELTYQPLSDIGINGLNTQDNPATLNPSYLTKAENVVIRESGRIAFRKGLKQKISPNAALKFEIELLSIVPKKEAAKKADKK